VHDDGWIQMVQGAKVKIRAGFNWIRSGRKGEDTRWIQLDHIRTQRRRYALDSTGPYQDAKAKIRAGFNWTRSGRKGEDTRWIQLDQIRAQR
jgi:phage terminase large subunit-like protein